MDAAKSIAGTIPTVMSAGLVAHNINYLKKKKKNFIGLGVDNIIGAAMIKETAGFTTW